MVNQSWIADGRCVCKRLRLAPTYIEGMACDLLNTKWDDAIHGQIRLTHALVS